MYPINAAKPPNVSQGHNMQLEEPVSSLVIAMFRISSMVFLSSLVSGFNWTITHSGKMFVNIHLDPFNVRRPCRLDNTICVPITYSALYCLALNSADSNVEVEN